MGIFDRLFKSKSSVAIKCKGCGRNYVLGENATVFSAAGILDDLISKGSQGVILGDGSSLMGNKSNPDLIAPLTRSWASLDSSAQRDQEKEIGRVKSSLSSGQSRWWRCRECNTIQSYK